MTTTTPDDEMRAELEGMVRAAQLNGTPWNWADRIMEMLHRRARGTGEAVTSCGACGGTGWLCRGTAERIAALEKAPTMAKRLLELMRKDYFSIFVECEE